MKIRPVSFYVRIKENPNGGFCLQNYRGDKVPVPSSWTVRDISEFMRLMVDAELSIYDVLIPKEIQPLFIDAS